MRFIIYILILVITLQKATAQQTHLPIFDSTIHQKIYTISKSDFQHLTLKENLDGTFSGSLSNKIWKLNKKNESTMIEEDLEIPARHVERLMKVGYKNDIEALPDSKDVEGYVNGLDGTYMTFSIYTEDVERSYGYWEPESDYYQDSTLTEILKVRNILSEVHQLMNLSSLYERFTNQLPSGNYRFGGVILKR